MEQKELDDNLKTILEGKKYDYEKYKVLDLEASRRQSLSKMRIAGSLSESKFFLEVWGGSGELKGGFFFFLLSK